MGHSEDGSQSFYPHSHVSIIFGLSLRPLNNILTHKVSHYLQWK